MKKSIVLGLMLLMGLSACEKSPGEGGLASIEGKILAKEYSSTSQFTSYYLPEARVYLHYGLEDNAPSDDARTGFDGSFAFRDLRKGDYRLVVYSECSPFEINCPSGLHAIIDTIEIKDRNQEVDLGDLEVEIW